MLQDMILNNIISEKIDFCHKKMFLKLLYDFILYVLKKSFFIFNFLMRLICSIIYQAIRLLHLFKAVVKNRLQRNTRIIFINILNGVILNEAIYAGNSLF